MAIQIRDLMTNKVWNLPNQATLNFSTYPPGVFTVVNTTGGNVTVTNWGQATVMADQETWQFYGHPNMRSISPTLATSKQSGSVHKQMVEFQALEAPLMPPTSVDVPYVYPESVAAVGDTLDCTMGNWEGEPTEYAYQWKRDAIADIGDGTNTYVVASGDEGHSVTCVVTATNAAGSTVAPPSNAVEVPAVVVTAEPPAVTTSTAKPATTASTRSRTTQTEVTEVDATAVHSRTVQTETTRSKK